MASSVPAMALCVYCKAREAELSEYGIPICLRCAELTDHSGGVKTALVKAMSEAKLRADSANQEFTIIMSDIPSGLPHPDGLQAIRNVSAERTVAQIKLMEAHARLTDYLDHGIVPEDLKRSGC